MPPKKTLPVTSAPSLNLYRRIAISFVLLVAVILAVVLYVSTVQATIRVRPIEETVKTEFLLDVVKTPTVESEIRGRVVAGTIGRTEPFTPSGEGAKQVEGIARGTVTISNTSRSSQQLVKTTRLLTPEGALFRIDKTVDVPAGGSVDVPAYADQPGKTGDIGPTRFTIPGLNADRQKVVYAENKAPFTGGFGTVAVITQADLDRAASELKAKLEADGKVMLRQQVGELLEGESFTSEILDSTSSVAAGSEASTFTVTMTVNVVGVFFDRTAVEELAVRKLYEALGPGRQFRDVNTEGLQASVEKFNLEEEKANVRVYLDGRAIVSTTSSTLDPGRFAGMKEEEVQTLLVSEGVAATVTIDFRPSWIRSIPRLRDHIYVEIE